MSTARRIISVVTGKLHRVELKSAEAASARMERKFRAHAIEMKDAAGSADAAFGRIEGYGAMFGELHPTSNYQLMWEGGWQDRIMPGAFSESLAGGAALPPMLYMHERGCVIGGYESIAEDDKGLALVGQVDKTAQVPEVCSNIYGLMKLGAISGLSIGFVTTKDSRDEKQKIREILAVELLEISVVDVPGIDSARISDVKSLHRSIEFLERALRDAGLSRREAKAVLAEGFSALRDAGPNVDPNQRDAGDDGETQNEAEYAAEFFARAEALKAANQ